MVPPGNSNANPSPSMHTDMSNANLANQGRFASQDYGYSETNMKNTVTGLSNVIALMQQQQVSLQQQQVGLQQQQASMEMKQDSISSTLTNISHCCKIYQIKLRIPAKIIVQIAYKMAVKGQLIYIERNRTL